MTYIVKYNISNALTEKLQTVISERKNEEVKVFKGKNLIINNKKD